MILKKWRKWIVIALLLPLLYIGWAHLAMTHTARQQPAPDIPYMIILGASLRGETLSLALLYRMEAALDYLRAHPDTIAVVSGGQGPGEWVTEASAMRQYLLDHGIASERIRMEDRSTSTLENIRFSLPLLTSERVLVVTNDFHAYRAKLLANRLGLQADTLAAPTPGVVRAKLWLREYAAILKSLLLDW